MARRTLLVVTGPSCAGKTTLAQFLGRELSLPALQRDVFKETLFDTLGSRDRDWSRTLGGASYDLLFALLEELMRAGCACIAESNFESGGRAEARLKGLCDRYGFAPVEILCSADVETLRERYWARLGSRHPGHVDHLNFAEQSAKWVSGLHGSLNLGGESIRVDTTRFTQTDYDGLLERLMPLL
jgi:predicted kinase